MSTGTLARADACRWDADFAPVLCSAILAHVMLNERLNLFGILGCVLCISGSITIVLHAPDEREIQSLLQVWTMALQPGD